MCPQMQDVQELLGKLSKQQNLVVKVSVHFLVINHGFKSL